MICMHTTTVTRLTRWLPSRFYEFLTMYTICVYNLIVHKYIHTYVNIYLSQKGEGHRGEKRGPAAQVSGERQTGESVLAIEVSGRGRGPRGPELLASGPERPGGATSVGSERNRRQGEDRGGRGTVGGRCDDYSRRRTEKDAMNR